MMKTKAKSSLVALLLAIALMLGVIAICPFTVIAAGLDSGSVSVNGHSFSSTRLYYKNGAADVTNDSEGYNAYFDPSTNTLTLNNYVGDSIYIGGAVQADINIVLVGNNVITTQDQRAVSNTNGGGIFITAEDKATLTVNSTAAQSTVYGIYTGSWGQGKLDISGKADVRINVVSNRADSSVYGAYIDGTIDIKDDAKLSVATASKNVFSGYSVGMGLYAKQAITINTSNIVSVDTSGIPSENGNMGIYSDTSVSLVNATMLNVRVRGGSYAVPVYPASSISSWTDYEESTKLANSLLTANYTKKGITSPVIVFIDDIEVDQETNMGGAPSALVGQPYSAQVVATGGDLTYKAGAGEYMKLPEGLTIDPETGAISGTCTAEPGRYNVYIEVSNSAGSAHAVVGMTVGDDTCIPSIETAAGSLGETFVDSGVQFTVSAVNNDASLNIYDFKWSLKSGALPTGMRLAYTESRTVYIVGTPTETGTFTFELEAENDFGSDSRTFSVSVVEGSVRPEIYEPGESLGYGVVDEKYEYQLEASGTNSKEDPMLWSADEDDFSKESYDLGNGLTLSNTGLITGTPTSTQQVSFFAYAKNSKGTDEASFFIIIHENGKATTASITPEVTVVAKGSQKEFTISLEGYGDVEQVGYWSFYMWDDELGKAFPQPTDSELSVNSSTPSKTVTLTVGENEERGQIRVVAYSKPGNGGIKAWATVTIVEKEAVVYNVSFDKNGGDGAMDTVPVIENGTFQLPDCKFTAPQGQEFKCWLVNGAEKAVGDVITVTADTVVKAVWADAAMKGDVNKDGNITNADVLMIYRYIYNSELYPLDTELADVNKDGSITNADVLMIYRYIYNPSLYPIE